MINTNGLCRLAVVAVVLSSLLAHAQSAPAPVVPRLVSYSGKAVNAQGEPLTGTPGITFAIYNTQYEGTPLWVETQNVSVDAKGDFSVQLGAATAEGVPVDLFASGEARWLGVRVGSDAEQPRVLLVSVPYALKAADAQTLGGLPASAFALASPTASSASSADGTTNVSASGRAITGATSDVTTTGGTANTIPLFTTATNIQNSILTQTGTTAVSVNGNLSATGTITATGAVTSSGVVTGSSFQIGSNLFGFGSYSLGSAYLGFAGRANDNTVGASNTGVGYGALMDDANGSSNTAVGEAALAYNTGGSQNTASGVAALYANTTGSMNTAVGANSLTNTISGSYNTAVGGDTLTLNGTGPNEAFGYAALAYNTSGINNQAFGYEALINNTASGNQAFGYKTMFTNTSGADNAAFGGEALYYNNSGQQNTAVGGSALYGNTTGSYNTAVGQGALVGNTTGSTLTCIGYDCSATDGIRNATAIGAHALVEKSNSLVLGGTGNYAVNVGIGTTTPSNILTIGRGAGHPVSDSWETYSSRRWKTNIETLPDALGKIEQLRGVSYDLKDSGKHEIGVIAEEVGAVVPEVVTFEDNGEDARGVDYGRLTALLIEAVKQQQQEIRALQAQLMNQSAKGK